MNMVTQKRPVQEVKDMEILPQLRDKIVTQLSHQGPHYF